MRSNHIRKEERRSVGKIFTRVTSRSGIWRVVVEVYVGRGVLVVDGLVGGIIDALEVHLQTSSRLSRLVVARLQQQVVDNLFDKALLVAHRFGLFVTFCLADGCRQLHFVNERIALLARRNDFSRAHLTRRPARMTSGQTLFHLYSWIGCLYFFVVASIIRQNTR